MLKVEAHRRDQRFGHLDGFEDNTRKGQDVLPHVTASVGTDSTADMGPLFCRSMASESESFVAPATI